MLVTVVTTAGTFPAEGAKRYLATTRIAEVLADAAHKLHLTGTQGWIVARLLTPDRGAIVVGRGLAEMREAADPAARVRWRAEPGVVGKLGPCDDGWCEFAVGARKGWIRSARVWGAGEP